MLDARSANAFESCTRAILIEAGVTGFVPQVSISHNGVWIGRVDLAHLALRIIIECDGFETHGTLAGMTADATRHTWLVSAGWRPLRFTWHQVMFQPDWVLDRVLSTVSLAGGCSIRGPSRRGAPPATPHEALPDRLHRDSCARRSAVSVRGAAAVRRWVPTSSRPCSMA